jgi:ABC-2 type transport system permease protein
LNITILAVIVAGLVTTLGVWIGILSQNTGITIYTLSLASINALVPTAFLIGVGVLAFGFYPRLTSMFSYTVMAWSLLVELVGNGLKLNHWILDTSLLHQVVLAPSVHPNWSVDLIIVGIAIIFVLIGALRFNSRDIEGE